MESKEKELDVFRLLSYIWADKRRVLIWGAAGLVVGLVVAYSIPKEYVTEVQIASESESKSNSSSLGGLAVMAGIDLSGGNASYGISAEIYPQIIKSTPFLLEFVDVMVEKDKQKMTFYDYMTKEQKIAWWGYVMQAPMKFIGWIFSPSDEGAARQDTLNLFNPNIKQRLYTLGLSNRISILPDKASTIIKLSIRMQDPVIAAVIADTLVNKLQEYMTAYKTSKVREDLRVNTKMMEEAREKYYLADSLYATAKDRNQNLTSKVAQTKLDRLENEKNLTFSVYEQLASLVAMSKVKLQNETSIATVIEPASVAIGPASPNKKMVIIAFCFLGVVCASGYTIVRKLFYSRNDSE